MDYFFEKFGWKWPVVISLILIVAYGGFYYVYKTYGYNYTSHNAQIETSDWKIYTNTKYGFEVQYPATFSPTIIDYRDPESLLKNNIDATFDSGDLFLSIDEFINDSNNLVCAQYNITVQKTGDRNVDEWLEYFKETIETPSNYDGMQISGKITSVEELEIQGNKAKLIAIQGGFPFFSEQFVIMSNEKFYSINYLDMSSESDRNCANNREYYKDIFNKMVSTFTFTK